MDGGMGQGWLLDIDGSGKAIAGFAGAGVYNSLQPTGDQAAVHQCIAWTHAHCGMACDPNSGLVDRKFFQFFYCSTFVCI
jgi:hypothetical protein